MSKQLDIGLFTKAVAKAYGRTLVSLGLERWVFDEEWEEMNKIKEVKGE